MYQFLMLILMYSTFAIVAFANQGANFNSKDTFINPRQSPNGAIIAKINKSDFLPASLVDRTDSTNPHWIQIIVGNTQGALHKRDIVALDEKGYQNYLQTPTKLNMSYQEALLADSPSIKTNPKATLESIFTPNTDDLSESFARKKKLLNTLEKAKYQQALAYAIILGFSHTTELLLKEKLITLELESSKPAQFEALDTALMAMQTLQKEDHASAQETAVLFIDSGADPTRALQSVGIGSDIEMITLLLTKDVSINDTHICLQGQNSFAYSPLVAIAVSKQTQGTKFPIQNGANTAIYDKESLSLVQHIENLQNLIARSPNQDKCQAVISGC
ncbi:hypothetical protein [Helicobacter sp.]|uniref:hypothetical protein n=1 Tax=Helicobacter sp. TaxID=218 RepID=UPI0025BC120E|nr:hypothetical protein [Helicobacter sp.]MBR2493945.1 hypothetical protein [Helicobacter sp.]